MWGKNLNKQKKNYKAYFHPPQLGETQWGCKLPFFSLINDMLVTFIYLFFADWKIKSFQTKKYLLYVWGLEKT